MLTRYLAKIEIYCFRANVKFETPTTKSNTRVNIQNNALFCFFTSYKGKITLDKSSYHVFI